jgi:hypothetical protein
MSLKWIEIKLVFIFYPFVLIDTHIGFFQVNCAMDFKSFFGLDISKLAHPTMRLEIIACSSPVTLLKFTHRWKSSNNVIELNVGNQVHSLKVLLADKAGLVFGSQYCNTCIAVWMSSLWIIYPQLMKWGSWKTSRHTLHLYNELTGSRNILFGLYPMQKDMAIFSSKVLHSLKSYIIWNSNFTYKFHPNWYIPTCAKREKVDLKWK